MMLCGPVAAAAPEALTAINRAVHTAFVAQQVMLTDNNNLLQMRLQLRSTEKDAVDALTTAANDAFAALDEAVMVGQILHKMSSPEDQDTVCGYFTSAAGSFVKSADADLESINFSLDRITTAAAHSEAVRVRDKIAEAANALRPFAGKSTD